MYYHYEVEEILELQLVLCSEVSLFSECPLLEVPHSSHAHTYIHIHIHIHAHTHMYTCTHPYQVHVAMFPSSRKRAKVPQVLQQLSTLIHHELGVPLEDDQQLTGYHLPHLATKWLQVVEKHNPLQQYGSQLDGHFAVVTVQDCLEEHSENDRVAADTLSLLIS